MPTPQFNLSEFVNFALLGGPLYEQMVQTASKRLNAQCPVSESNALMFGDDDDADTNDSK